MEDYTTSKYRIKFNKVNYDNNLEIKQFEKNAYVIKDIDYNNLSNRANFICKNCKLNFDLAKLCVSYSYGEEITILCWIRQEELDDDTSCNFARCYVILQDYDNNKKNITKKLKNLQYNIIPFGRKLLEVDARFAQVDIIRFVICTNEKYAKKVNKMGILGNCLFRDFWSNFKAITRKQKCVDVTRQYSRLWSKPLSEQFIEFIWYSLYIRIGGQPSYIRY